MQGAYIRQLATHHDPQRFEGNKRIVDDVLKNRGVRRWLETFKPDWRPEFRAFIDERIAATAKREEDAST